MNRGPFASPLADWTAIRHTSQGFFALWRLVTFAMVLTGFLALACTGQLSWLAISAFVAGWILGLFLILPLPWWRAWMTRLIVWCMLGLVLMIAIIAKFDSILYLLLFLALFKCYTLHAPADHMHALIMSFFMFLACSIITSSANYLAFMFIFIIFLMLDLIFMTIAREGGRGLGRSFKAVTSAPGGGATDPDQVVLPGVTPQFSFTRIFWSSTLTGLLVLVLSFGVFLILPHYATQQFVTPWSRSEPQQEVTSGYSDDLTFGALKRINLDDTMVLSVHAEWADGARRSLPDRLYLRGLVLDQYDENRWSRYSLSQEKNSFSWTRIHFPDPPTFKGPILRQRIRQNMNQTKRLFGAATPVYFDLSVSGTLPSMKALLTPALPERAASAIPVRMDWWTRTLQLGSAVNDKYTIIKMMAEYEVRSRWNDDAAMLVHSLAQHDVLSQSANETRVSADESPAGAAPPEDLDLPDWRTLYQYDPELRLSPGEQVINTQLPPTPLSVRLTELSRRKATASDAAGKIDQLLNWFQTSFEYSLTPETPRGMHPIDAFLTRTHQGHCEYFATAFVLLLRAQGIPARVATGFLASEWTTASNEEMSHFIVKQSDAHAWAEVWLDGYGWLTLDPTPSYWRGRAATLTRTIDPWESRLDKLRHFWRQYVLDYTNTRQAGALTRLLNHLLGGEPVEWLRQIKQALAGQAQTLNGLNRHSWTQAQRWLAGLFLGAGIVLVGLLIAMVRTKSSRRTLSQTSPVPFMNHLLRRLNELGWTRGPSQTPAEFISRVEQETRGRWKLEWILELYHRTRFAGQPPTPEEDAQAEQLIDHLK